MILDDVWESGAAPNVWSPGLPGDLFFFLEGIKMVDVMFGKNMQHTYSVCVYLDVLQGGVTVARDEAYIYNTI